MAKHLKSARTRSSAKASAAGRSRATRAAATVTPQRRLAIAHSSQRQSESSAPFAVGTVIDPRWGKLM